MKPVAGGESRQIDWRLITPQTRNQSHCLNNNQNAIHNGQDPLT